MIFTKRAQWMVGISLLIAVAVIVGLSFATRKLKSNIEQALGPNSEVAAIHLHWNAVEIEQLRIKAMAGWPAQDELRAAHIRIEPDLRGLFSKQINIRKIEVDGAYMSLLRTAGGQLQLLPHLLGKRDQNSKATTSPSVRINHIVFNDAAITFFDASIHKPALQIRTEALHAEIDAIQLPSLTGHTNIKIDGAIKGNKNEGSLNILGWIELASKESAIQTQLRNIDLLVLQPYLIKAADAGVKRGTLDLDLDASIKARQLTAPGTVVLRDFELDPDSGGFMGLPRRAVISSMQDRQNKIVVKFELGGNIDDPAFSLNENIAKRFGSALAEGLGVSFEGVIRGASILGNALGAVTEGAGHVVKGLITDQDHR